MMPDNNNDDLAARVVRWFDGHTGNDAMAFADELVRDLWNAVNAKLAGDPGKVVSFANPTAKRIASPPVIARSLDGRTTPGEPFVILAASDPTSDGLVEIWAEARRMLVAVGLKPKDDMAKVVQAHGIAEQMRAWRAGRPNGGA